jgi:CheY-like chemotaxis protein
VQPDPTTTRRWRHRPGLAICKQLVELLGGQIGVQSVAGSGTTFSDSMPAAGVPRRQRCSHGAAAPRAAPARQFRVLVAEDNRTNQMVAAGMLAMNGCVCEFAADGVEAVRAAQRERFDLIHGLQHAGDGRLRSHRPYPPGRTALGRRTPLVAMTANTDRRCEKCLAAGMDDYLAKPITLVELRHKLEKWLPHGDHPGAVAHSAAVTPRLPPAAPRAAGNAPVDLAVFDKLREVLGDSLPHASCPIWKTPRVLDELAQAVRAAT